MISINLPELIVNYWIVKGSKNSIRQLIQPKQKINLELIKTHKKIAFLKDESGKEYVITSDKNYSDNNSFILLSDKNPTEDNIKNGKIRIKSWIKHPSNRKYSNDEIITSWKNDFKFIEEDLSLDIKGLRLPQSGAIYAVLSHLKVADEIGTVVLPTGTGKTETMLSVLVANQCTKLLITVPSDSLRGQISEKFLNLGLLKEFGIVSEKSLYPKVGLLREKFASIEQLTSFFDECNVIISTMHIVSQSDIPSQKKISELCSHLFVDEAHHAKADFWNNFITKFPEKKVIQFTATPFRNDDKKLNGKIIFNFSLRKAQEQGYFKEIDFISVREYDHVKADQKISEVAIERLREDRKKHNHILMARCDTHKRADEVFQLYKDQSDLSPVLIHTEVPNFKEVLKGIKERKHKIIVCVDMLGEGFDLPELKVASFHDIKKSLPVTLQLAGRFTRTKHDEELGNASFIANVADPNVTEKLSELYAQDPDWNLLLPMFSDGKVADEMRYKEFMSGFKNLSKSMIPFQNVKTPLSTVVYKNKSTSWKPEKFIEGIETDSYEHVFSDINYDENVLIIVTASKSDIDWVYVKDVCNYEWNIIVVFWDNINNLLFIHASDKGSLYGKLAHSIIGEDAEIIDKIDIFRAFHNIKRIKLQNVGLREFLGKSIRFRMSVGADVESALSLAEKQKGEKAFIYGAGYEEGEKVSIGCSYKGRIWTKLNGNILELTDWCRSVGTKLVDESIDPNLVLKETLIPKLVSSIPTDAFPICVDWHEDIYSSSESKFTFWIDNKKYDLSRCELEVTDTFSSESILFILKTQDIEIPLEFKLSEYKDKNDNIISSFSIEKKVATEVIVKSNSNSISLPIEEFLTKFEPTFWFADGSALTGNSFVELKDLIKPYSREDIIVWDWSGVSLNIESQGVDPKITDSIQYKVIENLKNDDFDIIYDDDYSREIADVITIKEFSDKLSINLYHLKFAIDGKVSGQIKNLYEVCGQAQKSIHWKHKSGKEFFNHLLRRIDKKNNGQECSRLEKGSVDDLIRLSDMAKKKIPIDFNIFIVQPGFSKSNATDDILTLLGVTDKYLTETAGINLKVISSN